MKNILIISSFAVLNVLASCSGESNKPLVKDDGKPAPNETFEQRIRREVETRLEIPKQEKYKLRIIKEDVDRDGFNDAIVTVNRAEFAQNEAMRTGNVKRMAETDFSGYFNYFLYYDGATDKVVPRVFRIGSSPARELDVKLENITSPGHPDICISYRIKNSGFRKYYTIKPNHEPELMFEWDWFLNAGDSDQKGIYYEFVNDMSPIAKDILIYESTIDNNADASKDVYAFEPVITKKGKLIYHFFYDANFYKYRGLPNE